MRSVHTTRLALILVSAGVVAACGGSGKPSVKDPATVAKPAAAADASTRPIGSSGSGGVLVLASSHGKRVAFVADEDAKAILTIDVDTQKELAITQVGGTPSQVFVAKDGRILVTVRDAGKLVAMRVDRIDAPLVPISESKTPAEPVALAVTPNEKVVVVSTGWGQKLAAFDAESLKWQFETKLPREPRGVVVSDDGRTAFVSHAVGSVVSTVDLATPKHAASQIPMRGRDQHGFSQLTNQRRMVELMKKNNNAQAAQTQTQFASLASLEKRVLEGRQSCQGFVLAKSTSAPNRIFAPQVMVDPGDPERRPSGYGEASVIPEVPAVAVIDEATTSPLPSSMAVATNGMHPMFASVAGTQHVPTECLLPRAAAIDPNSKSLLVTCFGIDSVIAYDALSGSPSQAIRHQWNVGAGPTGIAVDPDKHQAVVFSQFDRTLTTIPLDDVADLVDDKGGPPTVQRMALAPLRDGGVSTQFVIGRMLFHASGDTRISNDGRACASCHPDGRDDAITWATPEGPRRSIMLAGRVSKTAPYSWDGNNTTIEQHLGSTFTRLKGHGLRSSELEALVAYISGLPSPPQRTFDATQQKQIARGNQIFNSGEAGCASCHTGPNFTDGANHDVSSKHNADRASAFNTPSLHLIGGAGPYFHDGRYATLGDLLRKSDGKMGHTKHLTNSDLEALQSFIETL